MARPLPTPVQNRVDQLEKRVNHLDEIVTGLISALQIAALALRTLEERDQ